MGALQGPKVGMLTKNILRRGVTQTLTCLEKPPWPPPCHLFWRSSINPNNKLSIHKKIQVCVLLCLGDIQRTNYFFDEKKSLFSRFLRFLPFSIFATLFPYSDLIRLECLRYWSAEKCSVVCGEHLSLFGKFFLKQTFREMPSIIKNKNRSGGGIHTTESLPCFKNNF